MRLEVPSGVFIGRIGINWRCKRRSLRLRRHGSPFQIRFEVSLKKSGVWVPIIAMKRGRRRVRNRQNSTCTNHLPITQFCSLFVSRNYTALYLPCLGFPHFLSFLQSQQWRQEWLHRFPVHPIGSIFQFISIIIILILFIHALRYGGKCSGFHMEEDDSFISNGIFLWFWVEHVPCGLEIHKFWKLIN